VKVRKETIGQIGGVYINIVNEDLGEVWKRLYKHVQEGLEVFIHVRARLGSVYINMSRRGWECLYKHVRAGLRSVYINFSDRWTKDLLTKGESHGN